MIAFDKDELLKLSAADLQAMQIYIEERIAYWEKVDTAKDAAQEKEYQDEYNMWTYRREFIDDEIANRIQLLFKTD